MIDNKLARIAAAIALAASSMAAAHAAEPAKEIRYNGVDGTIVIPASSIPRPGDAGRRAHTNIRVLFPAGMGADHAATYGKYETPGSLACVYGLVAATPGCNPATAKTVVTGGSKLVIIVDAYDDPRARDDLSAYSRHFGLPEISKDNFQMVYATGKEPIQDTTEGWELEESLDIEMAHAMAPRAKIILVEAASSDDSDLYFAETVAGRLAAAAGGGEVSNSWGAGEYQGEDADAANFTAPNVVFLASAGDSAGTETPSVFPNVIAVGGTVINRTRRAAYLGQSAWVAGGGGSSAYTPVPSYQSDIPGIAKRVHKRRGAPDISFEADPNSGVWVYDSYGYDGIVGWLVIGGTSVAAPAMAGIINNAGGFAASTAAELATIYNGYNDPANWTDIDTGVCGNNDGSLALKGYDFCTGIGVPRGLQGK